MPRKNYYLVLGVTSDECQEGIREAYRRLAKQYHPDIAGSDCAGRFCEITEAYEVLSDPERRRNYNREMNLEGRRPASGADRFRESRRRTSERYRNRAFHGRDDFFSSVFEHYFSNMERYFEAAYASRQTPDLEIVLSSEEARRGGRLPVDFSYDAPCRYCGGTGGNDWTACSACLGGGTVSAVQSVVIDLPPNLHDGTVLDMGLPENPGTRIRIVIRIR